MTIEEFVNEENHMCNLGGNYSLKFSSLNRFIIYPITSLIKK